MQMMIREIMSGRQQTVRRCPPSPWLAASRC